MPERLYIETTIPSFYYNTRPQEEIAFMAKWTKRWWDDHRGEYELFTSYVVLEELQRGNHPFQSEKILLMRDVTVLPLLSSVERAAEAYINTLTMPVNPVADALHLAFASVYRCDVLLTWNCSHLANHLKLKQIAQINKRLGLETPAIVTPHQLLMEEGNEP